MRKSIYSLFTIFTIFSLLKFLFFNSVNEDPDEFTTFIVKCIQDNEAFQNIVQESQIFQKEKLMYEKILPSLETISGCVFSPRYFLIQEDGDKLMVFNDLKELGFKMPDRQRGLDFEHCRLVMQMLGRFHASSLEFLKDKENSQSVTLLNRGMSSDSMLVDGVFKSHLEKLVQVVEEESKVEEKEPFCVALEKLKRILENHSKVYHLSMETDKDVFRVINHGDAWVNNFMFAYDEGGSPSEVILVSG